MKIISKIEAARELICLYGPPKSIKTRLATSLPWGKFWGEKALYVGYDENALALKSVLPEHLERLLLVQPEGKPNWLEEAVEIAVTDWSAQGVGTLIWDTISVLSRRLLRQYADSGVFSDKHAVQLGVKGKKSWHTSPMEGDFGAVQNSISYILELLADQPLHVIAIFHDDFLEPKSGSPDGLMGGPSISGKKAVRWLPGRFDSVLRTERVGGGATPSKFVVHTVNKGIWSAGVRSRRPGLALPPSVEVVGGQEQDFWKEYEKAVTVRGEV